MVIFCASCLEEFATTVEENHYCQPCTARINKNSKRKVENTDGYEKIKNKAEDNEKVWRDKGYM